MIAAVLVLALLAWGLWWLRDRSDSHPADSAGTGPTGPRFSTHGDGLEDDPDAWPTPRGPWTQLDERQLIRMLTQSAPLTRPDFSPTETSTPPIEHKDIT